MILHILKPGLQTTIQAGPRRGFRHLGIPVAGPADALSLALANRLLGNPLLAAGLEVTLSGMSFGAERRTAIAVTGADVGIRVNDEPAAMHSVIPLAAGDEVVIDGARSGARCYVSVPGGLAVEKTLGSASTYLPAALGGHRGRALDAGDELRIGRSELPGEASTPGEFRPDFSTSFALRACPIDSKRDGPLFERPWRIGGRADRMGLQLEGSCVKGADAGRLPSVPVYPGCVQCPPDGAPFLLSVDAQTTGGYARLAQVIRADRHLIGQLRAGDSLRFLPRAPDEAQADLREKIAFWSTWLPGCEAAIY